MKNLICAALAALLLLLCPIGAAAEGEEAVSETDIDRIAKTMYGECRGEDVPTAQKAAVVWCILNRLDSDEFPDTVEKVVVHRQFHGYCDENPVLEELREIVLDVVARWRLEKQGEAEVGRTLPEDYYYFDAQGSGNRFRKTYRSREYWDWSLEDPYAEGKAVLPEQDCTRE